MQHQVKILCFISIHLHSRQLSNQACTSLQNNARKILDHICQAIGQTGPQRPSLQARGGQVSYYPAG
jgi:hypothetical protein